MKDIEAKHLYTRLEIVLNAIADWVTRYRDAHSAGVYLSECTPDEVTRIANDLGVSRQELLDLAAKGPHSAALLEKMLAALGVSFEVQRNPAVMQDLQRLCVNCDHKKRCDHELSIGTTAENFRQFCPNAYTLDALLTEKGIRRLDRDR